MIDVLGCDVLSRKRNLLVAPDFDDVALNRGDLIAISAVLEFHRHYLLTDARLSLSLELIHKLTGDGN